MITRHRLRVLGSITLLLLSTVQSYAGGPLLLRAPGAPFLWRNGGQSIPFNPDRGGLGPLSNAAAVLQTTAAFQAWGDIPSASATHQNFGFLPEDVDETNFEPYLSPAAPDGVSAIVYDEDGAIFDLLFGPGSGVLGFAGPEWVDNVTGQIVEAVAFMNGGALLGAGAFPVAEMLAVQVHEFGHYQNLAHTVVNGQIVAGPDSRGPSPFDTFPNVSFVDRIETMYPFLFANGGMATPHADDVAMFSTLYPEPGFAASTGTITGTVLAPNNTTPVTGVNVIARNLANPYDDAVSAISSDFTHDFTSGSSFAGVYTLRGLTPGASYAIYIDQIVVGGFSTPPRNPLPGVEEFYNGPAESNDAATDLPNLFTPVVASAGVTVPDINIIFNRLPPGPIPAGDETSHEFFPAFTFDFCGQRYESVWLNSNGNLTFGAPSSAAFLETIAGMLTGPPRIAGLWDDLNADAAPGSISYSESADSITFSFTNIPEFGATTGNTFSITLHRGPNGTNGVGPAGRFSVDYGQLSAADGAAGYSCGGRLTSGFEEETDLSAARDGRLGGLRDAAVFEVFTRSDNDLDNRQFEFVSPQHFVDEFEPNSSEGDDAATGPLVTLPFNTAHHFTAVGPGDVDYYRFHAKAGDIIALETVPGLIALDTVLGLFDASGTLLIADDDGGAGVLSRLLVRVPVDGTYSVGVSTFPDLSFTGAGGDAGRYVLNISRYRGQVIPVGDDDAVEVPFSIFDFPFQGTNWSSVFVNGNGNLTFGGSDPDFSETVPELIAGRPRIAALWDDLFPAAGMVVAEQTDRELRVHFVSVPEFIAAGTNYFSVTLTVDGEITVDYGATNRSDAIVGVSSGLGTADPGPVDLSQARELSASGTTYEQFGPASFGTWGGVDLSFKEIVFKRRQ